MRIKTFDNSPNPVLRFSDGSRTREYFHRYDFTKDCLSSLQDDNLSKDLDYVDILIIDAEKSFRKRLNTVKVGSSSTFNTDMLYCLMRNRNLCLGWYRRTTLQR